MYEELLAVPVVRGRKSKKEQFAGAFFTTTVEVCAGGQPAGRHLLQTSALPCGDRSDAYKEEPSWLAPGTQTGNASG